MCVCVCVCVCVWGGGGGGGGGLVGCVENLCVMRGAYVLINIFCSLAQHAVSGTICSLSTHVHKHVKNVEGC